MNDGKREDCIDPVYKGIYLEPSSPNIRTRSSRRFSGRSNCNPPERSRPICRNGGAGVNPMNRTESTCFVPGGDAGETPSSRYKARQVSWNRGVVTEIGVRFMLLAPCSAFQRDASVCLSRPKSPRFRSISVLNSRLGHAAVEAQANNVSNGLRRTHA